MSPIEKRDQAVLAAHATYDTAIERIRAAAHRNEERARAELQGAVDAAHAECERETAQSPAGEADAPITG